TDDIASTASPEETFRRTLIHRLPVEIISIILDRVLKSSSLTMAEHNAKVQQSRMVCKRWQYIIDYAKRFWLQITSQCSPTFNNEALRRWRHDGEEGPPLSIEFTTVHHDRQDVKRIARELDDLMEIVHPYQSKWHSLNLVLPPCIANRAWRYVDVPTPLLKTLSLSIIESSDDEHLVEYQKVSLLGGEAKGLESLKLDNIPLKFDPSPFAGLYRLQVSGVTMMPLAKIGSFLTHTIKLEVLELVDVRTSTGPLASSWRDSIHAPSLRSLTLHDLSNPHLDVALQVAEGPFADDFPNVMTALATKVASVAQANITSSSEPVFHVRLGTEDEGYEWWSHGTELEGQSSGFHMLLRFKEPDEIDPVVYVSSWVTFPGLVKDTLEQVGGDYAVKLDIHDWLSGRPPTLSPEPFRSLNVVELVVNVVDSYLGRLQPFIIGVDSVARFPSLRRIHLLSCGSVDTARTYGTRANLEELVEGLATYYATREKPMGIVLRGDYLVSEKWRATHGSNDWYGRVSVDSSAACIWSRAESLSSRKWGDEDYRRPW
ncbi:hypothetical protein FRB90_005764, partial [Tulasnella sp. 427]